MEATNLEEIPEIVKTVRDSFNQGVTRSLQWRINQLNALRRMLIENEKKLIDALEKDLAMNKLLSDSEVNGYHEDIDNAISKLREWTSPTPSSVSILAFPGTAKVIQEPLGVVLFITPWNYPVSLITRPLIGAIAAGNAIIIKPSEVSENVSRIFSKIVPLYLDNQCIKVIYGGVEETQTLLKEKFDKIYYTGSTAVGRIIMKAAAEHLTPVILELGGKSPLIVDSNVDIKKAIQRIIWGKFINAGQTCIAPDYALVHENIYQAFLDESVKTIELFFGKNPKESRDFGRIINTKHVKRIKSLLDSSDGSVFYGGDIDENDKYVSPTIISNPSTSTSLMNEEIFGPLFPVIPIKSIDEAIKFVNERPKPLAIYIFSNNQATSDKILSNTSSGGACVNETILHNLCRGLPFGGVGDSGMGGYNGKFTFMEFSHSKGVLYRSLRNDPSLRFPPYTEGKLNLLKKIKLITDYLPTLKNMFIGITVVIIAFLIRKLYF